MLTQHLNQHVATKKTAPSAGDTNHYVKHMGDKLYALSLTWTSERTYQRNVNSVHGVFKKGNEAWKPTRC